MRFARRTTNTVTSLTLGIWLFALFVGLANACLPGQPIGGHPAGHDAAMVAAHHSDNVAPAECVSFCIEDTPLFAKLRLVQDQPAGHAFLVATEPSALLAQPSVRIAPTLLAHPPPGVPLYLRSLRLAL